MQQHIIDAIAQLVSQGKEPSVALVKAQLTTKIPMPLIIDVLSRYKKSPDDFNFNPPSQAKQPQLENEGNQLDRIEAKLDHLISLLEAR